MLKYLRILCAVLMFSAVTLFFFDWTHVMLGTARDEAALASSVESLDSSEPLPAAGTAAEKSSVADESAANVNDSSVPETSASSPEAAVKKLDKMTVENGSWPEKIQLIPALLHHSMWIAGTIFVLTLLFGRLYCSVICPLGILQDVISWISKRVHRDKGYGYRKPLPLLRWGILIAAFGGSMKGFGMLLSVVEPYSIFGRTANMVFRPIYVLLNNAVLTSSSSFSQIAIGNVLQSLGAFILILGTFFIIAILAWRGGRTWCNTICPVGTLLGVLSRFSIVKIRIDSSKCKSCGMCAKKCKSQCVNFREKKVDTSRCVTCFNCLGSCDFDALTYSIGNPFSSRSCVPFEESLFQAESKLTEEQREKIAQKKAEKEAKEKTRARREFLVTAGSMAASVPVVGGAAAVVSKTVMVEPEPDKVYRSGQNAWKRQNPVAPPGAGSYGHFLHHCTACHLCVAKCPQHVLKPSFLEYGARGMFAPVMDFSTSFCNYECTICSEVCPNGAINILRMARKRGDQIPETAPERAEMMRVEKTYTQMGKVVFVKENCVVFVDGTFCGACDEHCPTKAVSMVPYGDPEKGLTIPQIDETICIGCGGCESICPARPFKAIYVEGNPKQERRADFKETEVISQEEIQEKTENVDDWLF